MPFFNMMSPDRRAPSEYLASLQAEGRIVFLRDEAIAALGITEGAFLKAASRLQKRKMLISPRQGFYVVVPPQFLHWGAPPPSWYIDDLMRHEDQPYYVGLLKAAELHGATHQAVMEFQVVTDRQLPRIRAGRSLITFHFRKDFAAVRAGAVEFKTDTGAMKVSSPELTALDLIRYAHAAGGLDSAATIIADLADKIDGEKLAQLTKHFERSVVQRLGYLLDHLGHAEKAEALHDQLFARDTVRWAGLEPQGRDKGRHAPHPVERNERWRLAVRRHTEIDA